MNTLCTAQSLIPPQHCGAESRGPGPAGRRDPGEEDGGGGRGARHRRGTGGPRGLAAEERGGGVGGGAAVGMGPWFRYRCRSDRDRDRVVIGGYCSCTAVAIDHRRRRELEVSWRSHGTLVMRTVRSLMAGKINALVNPIQANGRSVSGTGSLDHRLGMGMATSTRIESDTYCICITCIRESSFMLLLLAAVFFKFVRNKIIKGTYLRRETENAHVLAQVTRATYIYITLLNQPVVLLISLFALLTYALSANNLHLFRSHLCVKCTSATTP